MQCLACLILRALMNLCVAIKVFKFLAQQMISKSDGFEQPGLVHISFILYIVRTTAANGADAFKSLNFPIRYVSVL